MDKVVVLGTPIVFGLAVAGLFVEPVAGVLAFVALHLQQTLALGGIRGTRVRGLPASLLLRVPLELAAWMQLLLQRPDRGVSRIDAKRPEYEELMAGDRGRFFERAVLACPLCSGALVKRLENIDLLQYKPGRFRLDRCVECGHIFQNPRLSLEGLSFYYRDFYDGLGEDALENIFSWASEPYVARARMVEEALGDRPKKVLDVGCGHGHFSLVARDVWPGAELDGLDLSDSVEDAARRRWIDQAYRGLFPELASRLGGRYDVVGMSHYLEHTIDPEAEIAAAAVALREGGMFLIELPDPESPFGRFLGRLWLPWFQPQHLHLLSVGNLEKLLRRHGFEPVTWHRGEAHQKVDLMFATYLLTRRIAPPIDVPWRPRPSFLRRLYHSLVWTPGALFILAARILDRLIAPLVRRLGASNTYRVVARKTAPAAARAAA
jgi:SAM-dependent methyltransferase